MSQIFHKTCYTTRNAGHKYRSLSTKTREKRRRDSKQEDATLEKKFTELQREITSRIVKEVDNTQRARETIQEKFETIESKINQMLEVQNTIQLLRQDLLVAEITMAHITERVDKLQGIVGACESFSVKSRSSALFKSKPIIDRTEITDPSSKNNDK